MRDKYKIIGAILAVIIIFVITRACSNYFSNKIREDVKSDTQIKTSNELLENSKNEYVLKYKDDWELLIGYFLRGLISYDEMPLSRKFVNKYPRISNIITGKVTGNRTKDMFDNNENMENLAVIGCKTGNGSEDIAYQLHYIINDKNELDDIEILDSRVVIDENGEYPHYEKYHYYYDDPVTDADILCFPYRMDRDGDYYRIYVTEAFDKKFPGCQDDKDLKDGIVGDKDYLICGSVTQDKEYPNICYAEFLDVDYIKTYKITFEILYNGYINDAIIELYKKEVTKDPEYVKEIYEGYKENVRWF